MKIWQSQKLVNYWKRLTIGSVNRQIFRAAVTVGLFTILVKIVAVAKELVVAQKFGTGDDLDAFFIAFLIPSSIISVVAGSFNAALIPTYIQVREREGKKAAQKLFSGTTVWSLGLLGITTILTVASAPWYLPLMARGFSPEKLDLTFHLLCAIAPLVMLTGFVVIWSAVLNAGERFAIAAVSPIITPIVTILLLLIVVKSWGIYALVAGLICGAALELTFLGIALHRQGISLLPRWYGFDSHLRQVTKQYLPMIAGALLMSSTSLVDQAMAAMLPSGSVAALNYGNKVIALPISLSTTALSTAVIPYFSKMVASDDWAGIRRTLNHYLRIIFVVTVVLGGFLFAFSELIVRILFQRGSFTANDTHLVAQIQSCFALQIPFYVAGILVVRLISAVKANHILMYGSAINLIANISLNYIFMQKMGITGIALSTSCVYAISFSYLFYNWCLLSRKYSP
ncbi:MAG: murein biosynthesis integral membrane protein MurJ [Aulosira sp. ZfuVER01]|nr:murein biosynthesis integral membrane protein MurJ [Aulosira sp. ZfuVER01]MDZ7998064.1 murein biosynthesis integral membrane protein MurJ [Aulosira sp. DedVER01a]MDZ8050458.1 murein biosynthesis integral membrane protein MurJ [Aulosira sp. ZfuCHP01]